MNWLKSHFQIKILARSALAKCQMTDPASHDKKKSKKQRKQEREAAVHTAASEGEIVDDLLDSPSLAAQSTPPDTTSWLSFSAGRVDQSQPPLPPPITVPNPRAKLDGLPAQWTYAPSRFSPRPTGPSRAFVAARFSAGSALYPLGLAGLPGRG